jgi:hypothetical protein
VDPGSRRSRLGSKDSFSCRDKGHT